MSNGICQHQGHRHIAAPAIFQLVFGRVPVGTKSRQRQFKQEVKVVYFRSLCAAQDDVSKTALPIEQPVQLAMFAP